MSAADFLEKKKRLNSIEAELKKRKNERRKLDSYNKPPAHLKQIAFHKSQARSRWIFGGNRSGKTECGAVETVWILRGIHPCRPNRKDASGWVVSVTTQVQRDVAQAKILSYLPKSWIEEIVMREGSKGSPERGVIDFLLVKNVFGGLSKLGFKSCDQGREKFQGASLDFVWFDEEPPEDIYDECLMRVMDRAGNIYATMTPLKGQTFVYDEIYLKHPKDTDIITMEWADNPYLPAGEIERLTQELPAEELESRRYGRFGARYGLVYPEFDPSRHIIEPFSIPKDWYSNISIDPGLNNPLSAHWYAADNDGNIYVIAEHYEAGRDVAYHAERIKEISQKLGWHTRLDGRLEALIDTAATARTLGSVKSVAELFAEHGILVNTRVNKDVFTGIQRVKGYLREGNGGIGIFNTCSNMIREFKGYRWDAGDSPVKKDDHALDELRYFVMSRPENRGEKAAKSVVQKDKERLGRRLARVKLGIRG